MPCCGFGRPGRRRVGSGLPVPHRRTFAADILSFAHCTPAALRHPACAGRRARLVGHGQPLTVSRIIPANRSSFDVPESAGGLRECKKASAAIGLGSVGSVTASKRGVARVLERAVNASEARMAERRGHAVNGGPEGRSERPSRGHGQPRAGHTSERITGRLHPRRDIDVRGDGRCKPRTHSCFGTRSSRRPGEPMML